MGHKAALRHCGVLIAVALAVAFCSKEPEYTDEQRVCIAKHYFKYNPKDLNQCVAVCEACMSGTVTTCTTSCKLKGAN
jgi:hypothetical protein